MKVLVLLLALASLSCCTGEQSYCTRNEKKELAKMKMDYQCPEPTERYVKIPVPDGCEYTMPSKIKVKRCDGHCWMPERDCLPTETEMKMVKVGVICKGRGMECLTVPVKEHIDCGCKCITSKENCTANQEFIERSCSCACKKGVREECGSMTMWREDYCLCLPYAQHP
ncbi:balbiani ring protein 3-like [Macrobrachium rosenbergii]|uniref:balbiani ring protein 3-like n=1 Tax=Macrobrachium rosenbergii TaxID=79674 RepID=UPI0034D63572